MKYIANQTNDHGLDEVQRLLLAYTLNQNVALSGPPGIGKTELVEEFAKAVGKQIYGDPLDEHMTEAPLIGFPVLEGSNGSTVSVWKNGWVTKAMDEGQIFYGDEFDLLSGSVQKRMNAAFDDRKAVTRRDGEVIPAEDGFFAVVSYNPSERISKRQLEESVADRFVHQEFRYLPSDLEAAIASGDFNDIHLEKRGVLLKDNNLRFCKYDGS